MKINLRGATLGWLVLAMITLVAIACGSVKATTDASPGGEGGSSGVCTWDQSTWDACSFAP